MIRSEEGERFDARRRTSYSQLVRLVRTDTWDDATREEWEDIQRWGRLLVGTSVVVAAFLLARLVTTSVLARGGIVVFVAAILSGVSAKLEKPRSPIDSAEKNSDQSP